ncbi:hypothetical protein H4219_005809 [Mycoemilia scoparia]|uniref:V-type proton ATPase subunit S1/VOA1 transmembrane domain-containing protein n=1 Tax=Mycoemilia scoparia TaxID=417184 RepID=A0A9W7ZS20_9FUNG|nr:hypothetical protein H4219_005809 [Mycoemilia scoparia]
MANNTILSTSSSLLLAALFSFIGLVLGQKQQAFSTGTSSASESSGTSSQSPSHSAPTTEHDDFYFSGWLTPGLIVGLVTMSFFFIIVAVGINWITAVQGPTKIPSQNQLQNKKRQ